jgi:hypothetical protein
VTLNYSVDTALVLLSDEGLRVENLNDGNLSSGSRYIVSMKLPMDPSVRGLDVLDASMHQ